MVAKLDVETDGAGAAGLQTTTEPSHRRPVVITAGSVAMLLVGALLFWAFAREQSDNNRTNRLSLAPAHVEGTPVTAAPAPVATWNCDQLPPVPATDDATALAQHFVGDVLPQIYAHNASSCLTLHFYGGDGPNSPIGVNGLDRMYNVLREFAGTPSNVQVMDGRQSLAGGWITDLTTVMDIRHADGSTNSYMLEYYRDSATSPWIVKEAQHSGWYHQ